MPPPSSIHAPKYDDSQSDSEDEAADKPPFSMNGFPSQQDPKIMRLHVSLPSDAKAGNKHLFLKEIIYHDGKKETVPITFTKKPTPGGTYNLFGPVCFWSIDFGEFYNPMELSFDINGHSIQTSSEKDDHFADLGEGRKIDDSIDRLRQALEAVKIYTGPPKVEIYANVDGTAFQVEDKSE